MIILKHDYVELATLQNYDWKINFPFKKLSYKRKKKNSFKRLMNRRKKLQ